MIDRRELIQRAAMALGGAISSSAALGLLSGCAATPETAAAAPGGAGRFLTSEEMATVTSMAEQIIPRTSTPGAIDAGVPAFIDRMMADFYQDKDRVILRAGLARVDADAKERHGATFARLTAEQQIALMEIYDREAYEQSVRAGTTPDAERHFFRTMKELTTVGFFTSEAGASKFLRYDPIPGPFRGDVPYSEIGAAWAI